jgi:hypothetical protein
MTLQELLKDRYKDGMAISEIEEALKDFTLPEDKSAEIEKLKNAVSKANSEAAENKRKLRETLSDSEQKAQQEADRVAKLEADYAKLLHESTVTQRKADFLALGYDEKLASETAEALVSGDFATVFANQGKHQSNLEKKYKVDALKDTPKPEGGTGGGIDFAKLTLTEKAKMKLENPTLFNELSQN